MKKTLSILIPVISIICVIGLVLWGMKGKESNTEITEKNESVDESEIESTVDEKNAIDENKAIELAKTYVEYYIAKEKESGVTFSAKSMADYKASAKPNTHGGLVYWYVTFELDKADDEQPAGYICELNAIDGSLSYVDKTK